MYSVIFRQISATARVRLHSVIATVMTLLFAAQANAIDVDAGDYEALPPGASVGLLYTQFAQRNTLFAQNTKVAGDNGLDTSIGILRYVKFIELGGFTVDPQILLPFGQIKGTGDLGPALGSASGFGDPILAATVWVQNNPEDRVYTGITPYLFVPIGSYDQNDALNLGENRWRGSLQVAHVRRLTENITMDLVGDFTIFGDNDDLGPTGQTLSQDVLWQAQAWFRYHLSPTSDLRFLASHTFGGETQIDGIDQNNRAGQTKYGIGGSFFVGDKTQILLMFGADTDVKNGFEEDSRFNLRFLRVF